MKFPVPKRTIEPSKPKKDVKEVSALQGTVVEMKAMGYTNIEIAMDLKIDESDVARIVAQLSKRWTTLASRSLAEAVGQEVAAANAMLSRLHRSMLENPDNPITMKLIADFLKLRMHVQALSQRMAKQGLESSTGSVEALLRAIEDSPLNNVTINSEQ